MEQSDEADPSEGLGFKDLCLEEIIGGAMMLIIVLSVAWGVVTRYLLGQPADWTSEAAAIAFAWVVFISAAAVFGRGEHSAVDALLVKLPAPLCWLLQCVADFVTFSTLAIVAWLAIGFARSTMDVPTTVLHLPQSVTYSAAAIGFTLMALRHLLFVFRSRGKGTGE